MRIQSNTDTDPMTETPDGPEQEPLFISPAETLDSQLRDAYREDEKVYPKEGDDHYVYQRMDECVKSMSTPLLMALEAYRSDHEQAEMDGGRCVRDELKRRGE